jgi:hypothetical protein
VRLIVGQRVQVTLESTFWQFAPADGTVLRVVVAPHPQPAASCIPGGGCGVVTVTYLAAARGNVDVTAHRSSCGEAMGCTAKTGSFVVHVVVG